MHGTCARFLRKLAGELTPYMHGTYEATQGGPRDSPHRYEPGAIIARGTDVPSDLAESRQRPATRNISE